VVLVNERDESRESADHRGTGGYHTGSAPYPIGFLDGRNRAGSLVVALLGEGVGNPVADDVVAPLPPDGVPSSGRQ
jgi:hypothetical protein